MNVVAAGTRPGTSFSLPFAPQNDLEVLGILNGSGLNNTVGTLTEFEDFSVSGTDVTMRITINASDVLLFNYTAVS